MKGDRHQDAAGRVQEIGGSNHIEYDRGEAEVKREVTCMYRKMQGSESWHL